MSQAPQQLIGSDSDMRRGRLCMISATLTGSASPLSYSEQWMPHQKPSTGGLIYKNLLCGTQHQGEASLPPTQLELT